MIATIDIEGVIMIEAQNTLEAFALRTYAKDNHDKMLTGPPLLISWAKAMKVAEMKAEGKIV